MKNRAYIMLAVLRSRNGVPLLIAGFLAVLATSFSYIGCGGGGGSSGSSASTLPTPPAQVTSPNPANNAINVITTTQISWASASGATSYDVYFGLTTTGWSPVINTPITSYNPAALSSNTIYYWRINSKNTVGTTQGVVWNFTTTSWICSTLATNLDYNSSIAIDANNKPHICYRNSQSYGLSYATNITGNWVITIADVAVGAGNDCSIALDSNNKAHISHYGGAPKYTTNESGVWVTTSITNTGGAGNWPSIAVTGTAPTQVHISYGDENTNLAYATNITGGWVIITVDSAISFAFHTSIAIDSNNKMHISYWDYGNDGINGKLKYATNASGVWVCSTLDSTGCVGGYTSIAIDSSNKVHISYWDYTNGDLKYATNASGVWVCSTLDSADRVGGYTSIAIDSNNKVHISYYDSTNSDLKYATNATGSWICSTIDSTGDVGDYTSIAIDSNNKVHISYYDSINGDLKYATNK
ncbi:MAG: hypothetical protein V1871_07670 [Planctomycetota bacterium]